ncbi:uncharacterized protein SPPG_00430 [Spizellomyces punctatus DAOM BR117]|uniref:Isochorismatase-like domain-containing protein n=1 Tax=Spizellomyces punctatus (strain DAOM BR117) TaxID=645134 RepID=A0A0L0HV27_SPIPD|nr:uncharacterized protein SPPG_00430 [Spizellomyces punctatus DAOM BR117]KND04724.1 hypothetical protein SPPG_00430 [Spizellomyces punctatus DAOM BR117]|eukprot:XP_016612763.1 hypothetical protein SPPG_00430 [Spizellomyces punctatus DAOM BR117]
MANVPPNSALLLIDVQQGFDQISHWGIQRNNPHAEENMSRLLSAWRATSRPVLHVQHTSTSPTSPLRPFQSGCAIKPVVAPLPGELLLTKTVNSAFIGTDLEKKLREDLRTNHVVIVGLTTDHCVSTTTRMAGNLGFEVLLVEDATATFDRVGPSGKRHDAELVHELALASLIGEFASIVSTDAVLRTIGAG